MRMKLFSLFSNIHKTLLYIVWKRNLNEYVLDFCLVSLIIFFSLLYKRIIVVKLEDCISGSQS